MYEYLNEQTPPVLQRILLNEDNNVLMSHIAKLPTKQHNIIIAMLHGVSIDEYAALMKIKPRTAKDRYVKALKQLRKYYKVGQ